MAEYRRWISSDLKSIEKLKEDIDSLWISPDLKRILDLTKDMESWKKQVEVIEKWFNKRDGQLDPFLLWSRQDDCPDRPLHHRNSASKNTPTSSPTLSSRQFLEPVNDRGEMLQPGQPDPSPTLSLGKFHELENDRGEMLQLGQPDQTSMDAAVNSGMNVVSEAKNCYFPSFEPLQNGKVATQLDSSDQPSMDPPNIGPNVVTVERNIVVISSSEEGSSSGEGRTKRQKRERNKSTGVRIEVSLEDILKCSKMSLDNAARKLEVSRSTLKRVCRIYNIKRWSPRNIKNAHSSRPLPVENQEQAPPRNSDLSSNRASTSVVHMKTAFGDADLVTIRARYDSNTIKFQLSLSSGLVELHQKVAERLNLEPGSYYVKYKDEEDELILIACDQDFQDCARYFRSVGSSSIVVQLEPKQTS